VVGEETHLPGLGAHPAELDGDPLGVAAIIVVPLADHVAGRRLEGQPEPFRAVGDNHQLDERIALPREAPDGALGQGKPVTCHHQAADQWVVRRGGPGAAALRFPVLALRAP
jgi:hypothetical protein